MDTSDDVIVLEIERPTERRASFARKSTSPVKFKPSNDPLSRFMSAGAHDHSGDARNGKNKTNKSDDDDDSSNSESDDDDENESTLIQCSTTTTTTTTTTTMVSTAASRAAANNAAAEEKSPRPMTTVDLVDLVLSGASFSTAQFPLKTTFLKLFEKPLKIYAYLALRQRHHPIFLQRTLSYMRKDREALRAAMAQSGQHRRPPKATLVEQLALLSAERESMRPVTLRFHSFHVDDACARLLLDDDDEDNERENETTADDDDDDDDDDNPFTTTGQLELFAVSDDDKHSMTSLGKCRVAVLTSESADDAELLERARARASSATANATIKFNMRACQRASRLLAVLSVKVKRPRSSHPHPHPPPQQQQQQQTNSSSKRVAKSMSKSKSSGNVQPGSKKIKLDKSSASTAASTSSLATSAATAASRCSQPPQTPFAIKKFYLTISTHGCCCCCSNSSSISQHSQTAAAAAAKMANSKTTNASSSSGAIELKWTESSSDYTCEMKALSEAAAASYNELPYQPAYRGSSSSSSSSAAAASATSGSSASRKSVPSLKKMSTNAGAGVQDVESLIASFYANTANLVRFHMQIGEKIKPQPQTPSKAAQQQQQQQQRKAVHNCDGVSIKSRLADASTTVAKKLTKVASDAISSTRPKAMLINYRFNLSNTGAEKDLAPNGKRGGGAHQNGGGASSAAAAHKMTHMNDTLCPFCHLRCLSLNALMNHLTNVHFRFNIRASQNAPTSTSSAKAASAAAAAAVATFDVTFDDIYDGSYEGNPLDYYNSLNSGYARSRLAPTKRLSVTYVIVNNRRNNYIDLSQFNNLTLNEMAALNFIQQQQQQYNYQMQPNGYFNCHAGLQRVYYHTATTQPILPGEIERDSDDELDPEWLRDHTSAMINEFSDVNDGEKSIMRLWNAHCLRNNFICDARVFDAVKSFVAKHGEAVIRSNLCNNFLLHLANLHDYGLLKLAQLLELVELFNAKRDACAPSIVIGGGGSGSGNGNNPTTNATSTPSSTAPHSPSPSFHSERKKSSHNIKLNAANRTTPQKI